MRYSRFSTRFFLFYLQRNALVCCDNTHNAHSRKERRNNERNEQRILHVSGSRAYPTAWCGVFFYPILIARIEGRLCLYILSPLLQLVHPTLQGWRRLAYDRLGTGSRADTPAWNTHFMWDSSGPTFGHSH